MPERNEFSVNSDWKQRRTVGQDDARAVAVASAPTEARAALCTLFALDDRLRGIVASTTEPMIGQMRLAWWRDALMRLDQEAAPAEPLLEQVQTVLVARGMDGASVSALADRWEEWLTAEDRTVAARAHGATLFATAAAVLGSASAQGVAPAGEGWALAGLAAATVEQDAATTLAALAEERFVAAFARPWPRAVRPLGVLALLARLDADRTGSRWRHLGGLLRFRLTGR